MDFPIHRITKNAQETEKIGEELGASYLNRQEGTLLPRIIVCSGDLGSGKTTFVKGLARGLGITTRLLSPTYIIVRRYSIPKLSKESYLYHLDLYRMRDSLNPEGIGLDEMLTDSKSITVIEWPEMMSGLIVKARIECSFNTAKDNHHEVIIQNVVLRL